MLHLIRNQFLKSFSKYFKNDFKKHFLIKISDYTPKVQFKYMPSVARVYGIIIAKYISYLSHG